MLDDVLSSVVRSQEKTAVGQAVLTEAVKHADILHTSLAGMTAIVVVLTAALSLPLWGLAPVTSHISIIVIMITAAIGIGVLYHMNYEVHHHVADQAALTEVLVNSLGQGFLTFDHAGVCGPVYSQACLDLLETVPAGKKITEVLHISDNKLGDFLDWLDVLYARDHALSFEDVTLFFPQYYPHSQGRRIRIIYRPIHDGEGHLKEVVLISTDQTEEYRALEQAKRKEAFADMVMRILKDKNEFHTTLSYLRDFIVLASSPEIKLSDAPQVLRHLHTLKALVRHFSLLDMGNIIQQFESDIRSSGITTDRQFRQQLLAGRQQLSHALDELTAEFRDVIGAENTWGAVAREIDEMRLYSFADNMKKQAVPADIVRLYLEQIVATPFNDSLKSFDRELHDLADGLNKHLKPLQYKGDNPLILTLPWRDFFVSLTHIARNIADHAIEAPSVRLSRGKDAAALVTITSKLMQKDGIGNLRLTIEDDGAGIDPQRVREKLSVTDPEGQWMSETDQQVIQRIFKSGFSTRNDVSELSGRGVGMDAVEFEVKKCGGVVVAYSELGKGTRFEIDMPYHMDVSFLAERQGATGIYEAPSVSYPNESEKDSNG